LLSGRCCTTCVNSCANNLRPLFVSGEYCPWLNTMLFPLVYARALIDCADLAATVSSWIFTWLKSYPNLFSMNDRVLLSRFFPPPELTTSLTMEGASPVVWPFPFRCARSSSSHSAHLRCTDDMLCFG